ncbi:hypothetical protein GWD52_12310 [Enterobacteriaceae bacterium 4M9]|nr:hypothetical protein [Enterobacteriaceae bacterium 4M9]
MDIIKKRVQVALFGACLICPQVLWAGEYKAVWVDNEGKHDVKIATSTAANMLRLTGSGLLNGTARWSVEDKLEQCGFDSEVKLFPDAFDVVDVLGDKISVFLFSYRISCLGELEPGMVKYVAFYKGAQYTLKGEETLKIGDDAWGGTTAPQASSTLKQNKALYNYMMTKWKMASTTVIR